MREMMLKNSGQASQKVMHVNFDKLSFMSQLISNLFIQKIPSEFEHFPK